MPIAHREHALLHGLAAPRADRRCARSRRIRAILCAALAALFGTATVALDANSARAQSQLNAAPLDAYDSIQFGADEAYQFTRGPAEVWVLRGRAHVQQGAVSAEANEAAIWVRRTPKELGEEVRVTAYLEGDVRIVDGRAGGGYEVRDRVWLGEFTSAAPLQIRTPPPQPEPSLLPQVFVNGQAHREAQFDAFVQPAQFSAPSAANPLPAAAQPGGSAAPPVASAIPPATGAANGPASRRLRAFSRSSVKVQVKWIPNPSNPQEWIGVIAPGVNLIIDGVPGLGTLDISTDRMVVWTSGISEPDLSGAATQEADRPLELYLEGNIVFREGDRVIYAERMYYNVNSRVGTILKAEVLSPVQSYQGLVRLKADVVRQLGESRFLADNALLTTSRMSDPRYRVQSSQIYYEDTQTPVVDPFTNLPTINPLTGETDVAHTRLATSKNNFVYLGPVPVLYWPTLATDLEDPRFYVRNVSVQSDNIFGQQIRTDFDMFQVLGVRNKPRGHDWIAGVDYLSDRGLGVGSTYNYSGQNLFGMPGNYFGFLDGWAIQDDGLDTLGSDRTSLEPEKHFRHRLFGRHRQQLPDGYQFTGEFSWISDRNFLEQYYELEWDTFKDQNTGLELKRIVDNMSYALSADIRLNKFFTQTNQLPRLDHFWLGQDVLGALTYYEHTSAEYAELRVAGFPRNPSEQAKWQLRPWEVTSSGERIVTAHELDMPLLLGPVKVTPYALGQAGQWGEALDGNDNQRLYGQAGIRAALPFWSVNPEIQNELFNVNGLAHKVVLDLDAGYSEANRDLTEFPLYDNLDDDAQEHFRRRFAINTFGGTIPTSFDERFYALRSGLGGYVSNPSAEIADDLQAVRMGLRQRWQTKRGPANNPRIVDWITFDTEAVWFPDPARDNFGEDFGLVNYDFRWHVGERFTLLSDGLYDFFPNGASVMSVGGLLTRPTNGTLYLGYRSLEGPFQSQVFISSLAYRLSPKWFGTAGASYDFAGSGTIGNTFSLVRIGESFLVGLNFNYDAYKDNFSGSLIIEPRFVPGLAKNVLRGTTIPPVGLYGLE